MPRSMDLRGAEDFITVLASTTRAQQDSGSGVRLRLRVPRVEGYFTGTGECFRQNRWYALALPSAHFTASNRHAAHLHPYHDRRTRSMAGDLFTALLLGWMHRYPGDLKAALELAVAGLQAVLQDTAAFAGSLAASRSAGRSAVVSRARELRLIPNQRLIAEPVVELRADVLD